MLKKSRGGAKSGLPDCRLCGDPEIREEWGCDKESKIFAYDLGGQTVRRCPNALSKMPIIRGSWDTYAAYKRGITPNHQGMRKETAFFHEVVSTLEQLEGEAESWYIEQMEKKRSHG